MRRSQIILDPNDLNGSMQRLANTCDLPTETSSALQQVVALLPRSVVMVTGDMAVPHQPAPLTDQFTFDIDQDELIVFNLEPETLVDAVIEMAMYLTGFSTMLGNEETWIVEFTIGAWKPVKNRIKRQLNLPVSDHPRAEVGLTSSTSADDPDSFRNLVSHYDLLSFYQMVMLAAKDDVTVRFPEETHPQVLAVYVYMRRSMHDVARDIGLSDYQAFNTRLLEEIQRLQTVFKPNTLALPTWLPSFPSSDSADSPANQPDTHSTAADNPFESFIEQLFSDDPEDDLPRP